MKIITTILLIFSFTTLSRAQDAVGHFQLVVAQAPKDWAMPSMVFKIDTATGQVWVYQIANVQIPEKYRSQYPKPNLRVDGWEPIPDSFGAEVAKAMKFPQGYINNRETPSHSP